MKKPTENLIEYKIECDEEFVELEGNASAIDAETDAEVIKTIRDQLANGNEWAWCSITVTASIEGIPLTGHDSLGCCSYKSREDFESDAYFEDMKDIAKEDLLDKIKMIKEFNE